MTEFRKIFLDTPVFIYLLEDHPDFGLKCASLLDNAQKTGVGLLTSVITRMEFSVKPYQTNQRDIIDQFLNLLSELDIMVYDINPEVADMAARLRSSFGIKPMDALQLAVCRVAGCDAFVTNDKKLTGKIHDQRFVLLSEYSK